MNRKLISILIMNFFVWTIFITIPTANNEILEEEVDLNYNNFGDCAGFIATGSFVKDGRSVLYKTRHVGNIDGNKVHFFGKGDTNYNYNFFSVGDGAIKMGMNEKGLAISAHDASGSTMSPGNKQYQSDRLYSSVNVKKYVLGNFDNVKDAAYYFVENIDLSDDYGTNWGIISSEYGVGAVVSAKNIQGADEVWCHISWINDSWSQIDNDLFCEEDPNHGYSKSIYPIWNDIIVTGNRVSSDGDNKVTWEDLCHLAAKNVNFEELIPTGTLELQGVSTNWSVAAMIAVSGNDSFNGALNLAFVQCGRVALIGTFVPLSAYFLNSASDIPYPLVQGDGFEDYVDPKRDYATEPMGNGDADGGHYKYYSRERVREIQAYANENEKYMFDIYQILYNGIDTQTTQSDVENSMKNYLDNVFWEVFNAYVGEYNIIFPLSKWPATPFAACDVEQVEVDEECIITVESPNPKNDPENYQLFYLIDWGDDSPDKWHGPYPPDIPIPLSHTYQHEGDYTITAVVQNKWKKISEWSNPITISVESEIEKDISIESINTGFGVSALIKNNGDNVEKDIDWAIEITGNTIFIGGETTGTIPSLNIGEDYTIKSSLTLGFGPVIVKITAGDTEKSENHILLLFMFI